MNRLRQPEEKTTKAKHAKLRADAESRLDSGSASETLPRRPDDVRHELQVHQIELEMQNESLRETQFELEESRDRYRDLYEFSPVGYLTLAHDGLISEINLTACTLLGRVRSQLLHRLFASLIADEDRDRWRQHFVHNLLRGETPRMEIALKHIDGTPIRVRLDCLSTTTKNEPSSLRIALTDISAQSRAEQELRIAAIAFESQQGMMVTDSAGIILRVNSAFTRRTGYSAREIAGKTPALLKSGRHELAAACAQIKAWSEQAGAETLMLAVNVSAREFRQKGFVTDLEKTLSASGADPTHLRLELAESLVITDLQDTIAKMQAVTALGVTFAMDDFGTGYSSLSALSSLPLNQLKIDQSFIRKLDTDRDTNNAIVTQSIIVLGHTLGIHVVAEGVETETQLDFLERHGCQAYQGNLFSEPLPLEGFENAYLQTLPGMIGAVSSTA